MNLKDFKYRLESSTKMLIEFTQSMVTNSISEDIDYLIEPNCREASKHLNEQEINKLKELNTFEGKLFNIKEVTELLYDSGQVPLWINTEIYRSTKKKTTVKLVCSRRFREEKYLNEKVDEFPPFHPVVSIPPWQKEDGRFNVNWKHQPLKRKWHALTWKLRNNKKLKKTTP